MFDCCVMFIKMFHIISEKANLVIKCEYKNLKIYISQNLKQVLNSEMIIKINFGYKSLR